jgi:GNAT superfamily N-acetyltransferase
MALVIRDVQDGDRAVWGDLWGAYLAFYKTAAAAEVYDSTFARIRGGGAGEFRGIIAWQGESAVGLAHYLFHRHCWHIADVCYLQDLFVAPAARKSGVGRALIEAVYARADAAKAPSVYWLTQKGNATARRLYDRIAAKTDFIKYRRG